MIVKLKKKKPKAKAKSKAPVDPLTLTLDRDDWETIENALGWAGDLPMAAASFDYYEALRARIRRALDGKEVEPDPIAEYLDATPGPSDDEIETYPAIRAQRFRPQGP